MPLKGHVVVGNEERIARDDRPCRQVQLGDLTQFDPSLAIGSAQSCPVDQCRREMGTVIGHVVSRQ
jgi:hypothetical protein